MPRPFKPSAPWARRLAVLWIAVPAVVIVFLGRSCSGSKPGQVFTDQPARVVVIRNLTSPGFGTRSERAEIIDKMGAGPALALLPSTPSPDPDLRGPSQVRVEELGDTTVFVYVIGAKTNPMLSAVTSTETKICQLQSALDWSTVAVGRGEGCIAQNPNGGLFVEWVDSTAEPDLGVHVETTATDENRLLAWLSTWQRLP